MEEDDEFGDFGGFEAAEPSENVQHGAGVEAGASPWAVFPPAVPQSQPDLLCAQNTFPTYLDPSGISGAANSNNIPHHPLDAAEPEDSSRNLHETERRNNHGAMTDQARIAENVLDGTLLAAGVPGLDLASGLGAARTSNPADICLNTEQGRENSRALPDLGVGAGSSLLAANEISTRPEVEDVNIAPNAPIVNGTEEVPVVNAEDIPVENGSRLHDADVPTEPDTSREESTGNNELRSLQAFTSRLEEELSQTRAELEQQRQRNSEMETRHAQELENLRQAGHNTLAVVVDQYKETTRLAILEQKEATTRYLEEKMQELNSSFHQIMEARNAEFNEQLKSQAEGEESRLKEAVEQCGQEHQAKFEEALKEERENHRLELQKVLESECAANQRKLDSIVQGSQAIAEAKIEEEQVKFNRRLQNQEAEFQKNIQLVLADEKEKMQVEMKERLAQEQENNRVAMETVVRQAHQQSQDYVSEQRQIDTRVRRRHLTTLDLFLESARQQLQLLQESDAPHSSSENGVDKQDNKTNEQS